MGCTPDRGRRMCNSERGTMKRTTSLLALLGAGLVTVLAVAGFSIAASDAAPTNQSPPTITGTTRSARLLTASSGSWNGTTPITYAYQWRRCDQNGGSCSRISGANKSTYTLKSADVGNTVRVRVTAKNSDGSAQADVGSDRRREGGRPAAGRRPAARAGTGTIDVAGVSLPARLLIDGQSTSPTRSRARRRPHAPLPRLGVWRPARSQGALVYATAVPFEQFNVPPEATTGCRRLGDADAAPGIALPGVVAAAAAGRASSVPASPASRSWPGISHAHPRLVPGQPARLADS